MLNLEKLQPKYLLLAEIACVCLVFGLAGCDKNESDKKPSSAPTTSPTSVSQPSITPTPSPSIKAGFGAQGADKIEKELTK